MKNNTLEDRDYDLYLYAVNTGSLYRKHANMGAENASIGTWQSHLRSRVVPAYYREFGRDDGEFTRQDISGAACLLSVYYAEHAKERNRDRANEYA